MDLVIPEIVKKSTPIVTCTIEGIVDEEDLRIIAGEIVPDVSDRPASAGPIPEEDDPTDLKKIRERHHSIARNIAGGMTQQMAAKLAGYTSQYIHVLLNNPAMQELLEMYRIQNGAATAVIHERLRTVGLKAVEKLDERMEAGELDNQALLGVAKLGLDRGGHGPSSSQHVVTENHSIDHAEIKRLEQEARRGSSGFIVDVAEVRKALIAPPAADSDNDQAA